MPIPYRSFHREGVHVLVITRSKYRIVSGLTRLALADLSGPHEQLSPLLRHSGTRVGCIRALNSDVPNESNETTSTGCPTGPTLTQLNTQRHEQPSRSPTRPTRKVQCVRKNFLTGVFLFLLSLKAESVRVNPVIK
jgi:hypothetical protein